MNEAYLQNKLRLPEELFLDNPLQYIYNVFMNPIKFLWDDRKNAANQTKHKVSFEEAQSIFFDENAIEYYDPDHLQSEDRFLMLGFRLMTVLKSFIAFLYCFNAL